MLRNWNYWYSHVNICRAVHYCQIQNRGGNDEALPLAYSCLEDNSILDAISKDTGQALLSSATPPFYFPAALLHSWAGLSKMPLSLLLNRPYRGRISLQMDNSQLSKPAPIFSPASLEFWPFITLPRERHYFTKRPVLRKRAY